MSISTCGVDKTCTPSIDGRKCAYLHTAMRKKGGLNKGLTGRTEDLKQYKYSRLGGQDEGDCGCAQHSAARVKRRPLSWVATRDRVSDI
jgi:hypothetical protein